MVPVLVFDECMCVCALVEYAQASLVNKVCARSVSVCTDRAQLALVLIESFTDIHHSLVHRCVQFVPCL